MHLVIIIQFQIEAAAFYEVVAAVFVQAVQINFFKAMLIQPFAGCVVGTDRAAGNDFYVVAFSEPAIDCLTCARSFVVG